MRADSPVLALRRQNKRLKLLLSATAGTVLLFGTLGAKKPPKVETADRYELVDDQGVVRGVMGTWGDSPYFRMEDQSGSGVMVLTQGDAVSMSMFTDSPRHPRVHVSATSDGSTITLLDRNGHARARVEVDGAGDVVQIAEEPRSRTALAPRKSRGTGLEDFWSTSPR